MFCKNCGEKLRDDAKFCKKCGAVTKYNRQLQAEVSAKMQEAESPKQQEAVAPKQLEIVAPKQQTNAPTKQDVYIYEKRENWGESKDDEIFGGKIWPWIVFGIFLTFLLTACAVTLYFVLKGNCVLP